MNFVSALRPSAFVSALSLVVAGMAVACSSSEPEPTNEQGSEIQSGQVGPAPDEGVACGSSTCAVGEVCCNPSCGICTPPDGACTQQVCGEEPAPAPKACVRGGCSGQKCSEEGSDGLASTCEWREEYACYQKAACERQADGNCGFTQTTELATCLADAKN